MRSMSKSSYLWMKAYAPRGIREKNWSSPFQIVAAPFVPFSRSPRVFQSLENQRAKAAQLLAETRQ